VNRPYTEKQGQYLSFIHHYIELNRRPPAEADMQRYFGVSAPSVHQMVVTLEKHGFISRTPGQARSIKLLRTKEELPRLGVMSIPARVRRSQSVNMKCPNCGGSLLAGEAYFKKSGADFAVFGPGAENLRMRSESGDDILLLTASEKAAAQFCRECGVVVIASEKGRRPAVRKSQT
jgi:repressor LexA